MKNYAIYGSSIFLMCCIISMLTGTIFSSDEKLFFKLEVRKTPTGIQINYNNRAVGNIADGENIVQGSDLAKQLTSRVEFSMEGSPSGRDSMIGIEIFSYVPFQTINQIYLVLAQEGYKNIYLKSITVEKIY